MKRKDCYFTNSKTVPSFKDTETLKQFLTPRGKILTSLVSKLAPKHQRALAREIKRARYMALLPYTSYQTAILKMRLGVKEE